MQSTEQKPKKKYNNKTITKETDIITFIKNSEWSIEGPRIVCLYQKCTLNDQIIGISYIDLFLSNQNQKILIENKIINSYLFLNSGEYPTYNIQSFIDFLIQIKPNLILIHGHSESQLLTLLYKNEFFSKIIIKEISYLNYSLKNAQIIIQDYLENHCNISHIQSMTLTSDILSYYDYNSQCAMFTLFSLVKKIIISNNDNSLIKFQNIFFDDLLFCKPKTKNELSIFQYQLHPSLIKGFGKGKEGLSIFNLFNKCSTSQGKKLLKNFFLFPLKNKIKLEKRYKCIQDLSDIKNYAVIKSIISNLATIKDFETIMTDLKSFVINPKVWNFLNNSLSGVLRIFDIFKSLKNKISIISELLDDINMDNIQKIYDFLSVCFEFGKINEIPTIKEGVSDLLDNITKAYKDIDEILQIKANEYRNNLGANSFFDEFQICFYPQIGYLVGIIKNKKYKYLMRKYGNDFLNNIENMQYFEFPNEELLLENNSNNENNNLNEENDNNNNDNNFKGQRNLLNVMKIKKEKNNPNKLNNENEKNNKNIKVNSSHKMMTQINEINEELQENEIEEKKNDSESYRLKSNEIIINTDIKFINNNNNNNKSLTSNNTNSNSFISNTKDEENNKNTNKLTNYEETLILQKLKISDMELQFQFHDEKLIYYKNYITEELDSKYGDLQSKILDCENSIFRQISKQVLSFEFELLKVNKFISFLDIFTHFYIFSDKYQLYKPLLSSEENIFKFQDGRNLINEIIILLLEKNK